MQMRTLNNTIKADHQLLWPVPLQIQVIIFIACAVLCLTPFIGPAEGLIMGIAIAQLTGHPFIQLNHQATRLLLQFCVVGLGFGMNVQQAVTAGREGFLFTVASILTTLVFGYPLGRWFKVDQKASFLITAGTAICGGSAIAAISPVIRAQEKQISVALGCVFVLNSVALIVFPLVGHYLHLSQTQFGLWCAIAIHDTSSVVGAASKYGAEALAVATTVKLARAIWIIPLAVASAMLFGSKGQKISIPYFIGLFVLAMVAHSYLPGIAELSKWMVTGAKAGLTLTLFLIGAGLSRTVLTSVGAKPFIQGIILWISISTIALYVILHTA